MNNIELQSGPVATAPGPVEAQVTPLATREQIPLLTQILSMARRRKWFILGAITGALLLGLLVTLITTPKYSASATLEIKRDSSNFINVQGAEPDRQSNAVDLEFYQTQYGLLRSRGLAERVASRLNLHDNPEFFELYRSKEADGWFENGRPKPSASTREQRIREAANILLRNFYVVPERLSRLVEIRFISPDPALAQRVINTWSQNFVDRNLERRVDATAYARHYLEGRLAQLRTRIDESERALVGYAAREGIVNIPGPSDGGSSAAGERSLIADDLANLNRALAQATADRVQAESRLDSRRGSVPEALTNMAITQLRARRAELNAEYSRLLVQFDPQYPQAVALHAQIAQLDTSIAREETRVQDTLRQTYTAMLEREQSLRQHVTGLTSGILDLRRRSIQYNIIQRDADTNRQLYDALLQRYKEIGVAGGVGVNNVSIVDSAQLPERPTSPRIAMNLLIALLGGLVVAAGGAFAMEQVDQGITDPTEVEDTLAVPLLGTIPRTNSPKMLDELMDIKSSLTEAYLSLNTNLAFATDHGAPRSLAVTSSRPAEGKTTTSFAIATALARLKKRVILVDSDLRSPSVHSLVGASNKRGVSNYLIGEAELSTLIQPTSIEGLSILAAGPKPPSAPELLASDRFDRLIRELVEQYDHVLFDAPPVMGLADAPLIANRVEGVVFVLESHGTQRRMARVAIDRLRAANAQIFGAVLTKFDSKRAHYGYGYEYGYGYGYGHSGSDQAAD